MPHTTVNPCLTAALDYLHRGWSPLVLCPPDHSRTGDYHRSHCQKPGKCPMSEWKAYQTQQPKEKAVRLLFNRYPAANVGVVMGGPGRLVGLDVDSAAGEQLLLQWSHGDIPQTYAFSTPAGGHRLIYSVPEGIDLPIKPFKVDGPKEALRILGKGSQTVMPPSTGANGTNYAWLEGYTPDDIPLAECPVWLIERLMNPPSEQPPNIPRPSTNGVHTPPIRIIERARAYLAACEPAIAGQGGHNQLWKICVKLIKGFHLDEHTALDLLTDYNATCQPPWSEAELRHKLADASAPGVSSADLTERTSPTPRTPKTLRTPTHTGRPEIPATVVHLHAVVPKQIEWLWQNWIPLGKLSVLDGDPDLGKSTVLLDLAARITTTGMMPNGTQGVSGPVLICSAEDGIEDTILPRLHVAQADVTRVKCITEVDNVPLCFPMHCQKLEDEIARISAKLVIIDPLTAYLDVDTRSDQEIRRALHPLAKLAERQRCAVIYLRHLNKGNGTKALYRGGGSIAIIGAARSGMLVARDPDNASVRIFAHTKHNLAPEQKSLTYELEYLPDHGACRVHWTGESDKKADDLLIVISDEDREEKEDDISKIEQAKMWLADYLADAPKSVKLCHSQAAPLKFNERLLRRAAKALGILFFKANGEWQWRLPPEDAQEAI